MATNKIDIGKITETIIEMTNDCNKSVDMQKKIKTDLKAIQGEGSSIDSDGKVIAGTGMEYDLEAPKINSDYELDFEGKTESEGANLQKLSIATDFDLAIFKHIGFDFDLSTYKLNFNFDKYSNTGNISGNYLQNFNLNDQMKIIESYFKIETLRYTNQQIYEKTKNYQKILHYLYIVAMVLNIIVPYLSNLVGYANSHFHEYSVYFAGASAIITFISYFFTRTIMSTVANKTNFEQMQQALTKLRFIVETVIMGSYLIDDGDLTTHHTVQLQTKYTTLEELYNTQNGFNLSLFIQNINDDLNDIYQFNTAFKNDDIAQKWLKIASVETDKILEPLKNEITKAFNQINKLNKLNKLKVSLENLQSVIVSQQIEFSANSGAKPKKLMEISQIKQKS